MHRRAKIVATIGPASDSEEMLEKLLRAGINVARLNFSHGQQPEHAERIARLRRLSDKLGLPVGILQDLQGPKVRIGVLDPALNLVEGEVVRMYAEESKQPNSSSGEKQIPVALDELFDSVSMGNHILLDDGHLCLEIIEIRPGELRAQVLRGGRLSSHKGINVPGVHLDIPAFTEKDQEDLAFGLAHNVDFVAISFVRTAQDIALVCEAMKDHEGVRPLLIAKLEQPEALDNLAQILEAVDGVMVARGDLGVEIPPEAVPIAQKRIIAAANQAGKIVITATQMLDSMIVNSFPTRAEASDVANAIFDGTDAVMLSGETASGMHPLEAVKMMDRIVRTAEAHFSDWGHHRPPDALTGDDEALVTRAARELAHDLDVAAVVIFTHRGNTALRMSKARARVPILAFTPTERSFKRMTLFWGVVPHLTAKTHTLNEMVEAVDNRLTNDGWAAQGQQVVMVGGLPFKDMRPSNMALLHNIGESV